MDGSSSVRAISTTSWSPATSADRISSSFRSHSLPPSWSRDWMRSRPPMDSSLESDEASRHPLPICWLVVLDELTPHVCAGVQAADDRIDDPRGPVDDVERWMKALLGGLPR